MQLQSVDPRILSVWRRRLIFIAAWPLLAAVVVAVLLLWRGSIWAIVPLGALVLIGLVIVWCWWWLERLYRALRFGIDETGIRIEKGVWWRSIIALPRARIQHSDVSQGPLQRRFGVATLSFFTAGTAYTKVSLPGLAHSEAVALRDSLIGMTEHAGV